MGLVPIGLGGFYRTCEVVDGMLVWWLICMCFVFCASV